MWNSLIQSSDIETASDWWEARGTGRMPPGVLPPDGVCVSDDSGALAMGWIYLPVGCEVGMVDWLVTRPGLRSKQARAACRAVFEGLIGIGKANGRTRLFASVSRGGMLREAGRCNFLVASQAAVNLCYFIRS